MANFCSDCANLDTKDKKVDGVYKCKKLKEYVPANTPSCDKFEKTYSRNSFENSKIYQDGEAFSDDDKPVSFYVGLLILIIILGGIFKLLGY